MKCFITLSLTLLILANCTQKKESAAKQNAGHNKTAAVVVPPKSIEFFGLKTEMSAAEFLTKFPDGKCEDNEEYPPYSKEFDPIGFEMHSRTMSGSKWKEKGVFARVKNCSFVPDEFKSNPVQVIFFENKIVDIYRSYAGLKQPIAVLAEILTKRIGSKPDASDYNDSGFIGYIVKFDLESNTNAVLEAVEWGELNGTYISQTQGNLSHKPKLDDFIIKSFRYSTDKLLEKFRQQIKDGQMPNQKTTI